MSAIPDEAPTELQRKFAPLGRYLEQRTGMTVQFVPATDYTSVVESLITGKIDLAWLGGFTYVQAMETSRGAVTALVQRDEDQRFTSKFVTSDPTIRSLADLRGKRFGFGSSESTSGHLMPRYFLLEVNIQPERDFRSVVYSGAHDATVALVESGKADAGVLNASVWDKLVEERNVDLKRVRVFATTPPYHDYNWTVRAGLPPQLVKKLTDAFLDLNAKNPRDAEILSVQRASRFVPTRPENYIEIKKAARAAGLPLLLKGAPAAGAPPIAAAADLRFALTEVANEFWKKTGQDVRITYGSSDAFASQIENGAPFQVLLSADEASVKRLVSNGVAKDSGVIYGVGRLALFAPRGATFRVDPDLKDLKAAVADGRVQRFVIPNPEHSPYGRAAKVALERSGLWDRIESKLVLGEDTNQAMELVIAGSSQGGIVPLALAEAPEMEKLGNFAIIPIEWHATEPLRQRMILLKNAGGIASAFYRYLQEPEASAILTSYGFVLP